MDNLILKPAALIAGCFLIISFTPLLKPGNVSSAKLYNQDLQKNTMPLICEVISGTDLEPLSPFSNPLSDTEAVEEMVTHSACIYKFYKPNDSPAIKISLSALTPEDARTVYKANIEDHQSMWGRDPERIINLGDSANFSYNADAGLCDECGLTVISKGFLLIISLKGQYEDITREQKKEASIKIADLLFKRLPQLN